MNIGKSLGALLVFGSLGWGGISGLVMPNGPYTAGQSVNISWTVTVLDGEDWTGIYFSPTGTAPWDSVARLANNATSYRWTVPNNPTTNGKIWILHDDPVYNVGLTTNPVTTGTPGLHTLVSNAFTIKSATPILTGDKYGHLSYRQTGNFLALDFGGQSFHNATAEICALDGKSLQVSKLQGGSTLSLSTVSLPVGNAILRLKVDGQPQTSRLIVIRP